jgi:hypothetical protein
VNRIPKRVPFKSMVSKIAVFKVEGAPLRTLVSFVLLFGLVTAGVSARSGFDPVIYRQFRLEDRPGTPLERASCQTCHAKARGGAPWNPFGLAVGKFRAKRLPVDRAVFEVLKLGTDADQDGFSDALEVFAGSLPGDPVSKPDGLPEDLDAKFRAAGGVELYAPR